MSNFLAELLGTMILIILGDGVVANVVLNKSKGQNSGWIVITAGWGLQLRLQFTLWDGLAVLMSILQLPSDLRYRPAAMG